MASKTINLADGIDNGFQSGPFPAIVLTSGVSNDQSGLRYLIRDHSGGPYKVEKDIMGRVPNVLPRTWYKANVTTLLKGPTVSVSLHPLGIKAAVT